MNICIDQGSDERLHAQRGALELHHLVRLRARRLERCPGHVARCGLYHFWVLMVICYNMPHGPWESWDEMANYFDHSSSVFFQQYAHLMVQDLGGESAVDGGRDDLSKGLWNMLLADNPLRKKGFKLKLNRIFGSVHFAREDLKRWTMRLMVFEYAFLEAGLLGAKKASQRLVSKSVPHEVEGKATTDPSKPTIDEKALRNCSENALVSSTLLLRDYTSNVIVRIVFCASEVVELWHGEQSRCLRTAEGAERWVVNSVQEGFVRHLCDIMKRMSDRGAL